MLTKEQKLFFNPKDANHDCSRQQSSIFFHCVFLEKIILDILCEFFARQRIHMKHQTLFSSKDKSEHNKVSSAAILFGVLRVKRSFFFLRAVVQGT